MIGKYVAAAKGPRNIGARGGAGMPSRAPSNAAVSSPRFKGSAAGLDISPSAWIKMNGSGYQRRVPLNVQDLDLRPLSSSIEPYRPNLPVKLRAANYSKLDYNGLRSDRDWSKLI